MKLDLLEARQYFADFFYGEHHLPSKIKPWGEGWMVVMRGELASTDFNEMTRLVLMAHERCIRVSVSPHSFNYIKLVLHKRDATADRLSLGHPTLEKAIAHHREFMASKTDTFKVVPEHESFVLHVPKKRKRKTPLEVY